MFSKSVMTKNIAERQSRERGKPSLPWLLSHCTCIKKELNKLFVNGIKKDKTQEVKWLF